MSKNNEFFDVSEINEASKKILEVAEKDFPKEVKKFLKEEGGYLKHVTYSTAKSSVKRKTGNLLKGIKQGVVFKSKKDGDFRNRVYGGKPAYHTNLLEYGHKNRNGQYTSGKYVFEKSYQKFADKFNRDAEALAGKLAERMLD